MYHTQEEDNLKISKSNREIIYSDKTYIVSVKNDKFEITEFQAPEAT